MPELQMAGSPECILRVGAPWPFVGPQEGNTQEGNTFSVLALLGPENGFQCTHDFGVVSKMDNHDVAFLVVVRG